MPVVGLYLLRSSRDTSRNALRQICIRKTPACYVISHRQYSQTATIIPPPLPTETTSKSSGLNPQLHPTGRPPLNTATRPASTTAETATTMETESSISERKPTDVTGGVRTPLRVAASNIPVSPRETVKVVYEGPLRKTVLGLKAFSISSLLFSASMTPFILTIEANLPMVARVSIVTAALGASLLSTGLIHYFLSPYVLRATYMSLSHQLNLQTYSLFCRRRNNVVNVDDLHRIEGEGYRITANLKNEADGKVWYIHPELEVSAQFWETLDRPRGGYKTMTGKSIRYKEKLGDDSEANLFEEPPAPLVDEKKVAK